MNVAHIKDNIVKQTWLSRKGLDSLRASPVLKGIKDELFDVPDDVVCGQVRNEDGTFSNPDPVDLPPDIQEIKDLHANLEFILRTLIQAIDELDTADENILSKGVKSDLREIYGYLN